MRDTLSDVFRKVPTKVDVKKLFRTNSNYNLKLLTRFRNECYSISEDFYMDKRIINNFYEYLYKNINFKKKDEIQKIVFILMETNNILDKIKEENILQSNESIQSINHIKNNLTIFISKIADAYNVESKELIRIVSFNKIIEEILKKRDIDELKPLLLNNINVLNFHNIDNVTFDEFLYKEFIKAKKNKKNEQINYYLKLIRYVVMIPKLTINKEKLYEIINNEEVFVISSKKDDRSPIQRKIESFEYNDKKNRYDLTKEFMFSIDSDDTKKIDDAFSIEKYEDGYIIGIHIADTFSRGFNENVLLGKKQYLSSSGYSVASLEKGIIKKANSLFLEINRDGQIKDTLFIPTKIKLDCNVKEKDIENLLLYDKLTGSLEDISEEEKSILLGGLNSLLRVYTMIVNDNLVTYPDAHNLGNHIVEKFMILYNCVFSKHFSENDLPLIYLNGSNENSEFSLENKGYETGFKDFNCYCKATSPIIDRASSISQVLLNKFCFQTPIEEEIPDYKNALKSYVKKLNTNRQ